MIPATIQELLPQACARKAAHAQYHRYQVRNGELCKLNDGLRQQAEDIALLANAIGARSIADVGCNLGDFIFFMEWMADRTELLGLEADKALVEQCLFVAELLDSRARFQCCDFMRLAAPAAKYDTLILRNVYPRLFDRIGEHEPIFRKLAEQARSLIWHNPTSSDRFSRRQLFEGALKAGFLHPIPLRMRYREGDTAGESWLFVLDEREDHKPAYIDASGIDAVAQELRPHFAGIHEVSLDDKRSYKTFLDRKYGQTDRVLRAMECGLFDRRACGPIDFVVDKERNVLGYSQRRGVAFQVGRQILGGAAADAQHARQVWVLFSRMLRHGAFCHDVGTHNFVFLPACARPIMIDIENIVFDAHAHPALSIYCQHPDENETKGAERNLKRVFKDVEVSIAGRAPTQVLWECLEKSAFLAGLDLCGLLRK